METKFNFNSQVCTDRNQSERLLALGLKKETADCYWFYCDIAKEWKCTILSSTQVFKDYPTTVIPAWSPHRLIDLCPISIRHMGYHYSLIYDIHRDWVVYMLYANGNNKPYNQHLQGFQNCNRYDAFIDCIEWLIKEGYFNKEYLVNQAEVDEHCKGVLEYLDYIRGEEE